MPHHHYCSTYYSSTNLPTGRSSGKYRGSNYQGWFDRSPSSRHMYRAVRCCRSGFHLRALSLSIPSQNYSTDSLLQADRIRRYWSLSPVSEHPTLQAWSGHPNWRLLASHRLPMYRARPRARGGLLPAPLGWIAILQTIVSGKWHYAFLCAITAWFY